MKEITLPKASQLTSPNPVTVVCTQKPDGSTNLATVSWWTYLSYNPNMIAYAMPRPSSPSGRLSAAQTKTNRSVLLSADSSNH